MQWLLSFNYFNISKVKILEKLDVQVVKFDVESLGKCVIILIYVTSAEKWLLECTFQVRRTRIRLRLEEHT
jgi:hypothetical protein